MKSTKLLSFAIATLILSSCGSGSGTKNQTPPETGESEQKIVEETIEPVVLPPALPQGALSGVFSISASRQIRFSQGNLQYLPATKKWQFAKHQYDYVGMSNEDISKDYDGWIDLFGWGTSGWNNGGNAYDPTSIEDVNPSIFEENCNYYGPKGTNDFTSDLTGKYSKADWGVYNAIINGGNEENLWRTLTAKEWEYLLYKRPEAMQLLALGSVGGVKGLFILPDDFENDNLFSTLGDYEYVYKTFGDGIAFYDKYSDYSVLNDVSKSVFAELEKIGVVFLPAAGHRAFENSVSGLNTDGYYWTATHGEKKVWNNSFGEMEYDKYVARQVHFWGEAVALSHEVYRNHGSSVRLVQDVME